MLKALITLEITGADISGTLRAMNNAEITLLATVPKGELTVQVTVLRQDYGKCKRIIEKRGDKITVKNRRGLYWTFRRLLDRPVLVLGMLLILAAALYLPSRVLFVRVEGNHRVPSRKILATAENCGIGFGASRRAVRSEKMKNNLLEAVPELQWAGVNTQGCVAVITVRERAEQGWGSTRRFRAYCGPGGRDHYGLYRHPGQPPLRPGTGGAAGSDPHFRLHRHRAHHTGRTGIRRGFRTNPAADHRGRPPEICPQVKKRGRAEKNQPSHRKKTHNFMEFQ